MFFLLPVEIFKTFYLTPHQCSGGQKGGNTDGNRRKTVGSSLWFSEAPSQKKAVPTPGKREQEADAKERKEGGFKAEQKNKNKVSEKR